MGRDRDVDLTGYRCSHHKTSCSISRR